MKLSSSNITEFQKGILLSSLPQTFQDALLVAKRLGIRYLWIDSVCIFQSGPGSFEDWQIESNLMDRVYQYAYCNISATGSRNCDESLFQDRNPSPILPTAVQAKWSYGQDHRTDCPKQHYLVDIEVFLHGLEKSDLLNRGWVLQERLLAPRILHFGKSQLYWECNELQACETSPMGMAGRSFLKQNFHIPESIASLYHPTHRSVEDRSTKLDSAIGPRWEKIVAKYTGCGLTKQSDRLIGLSGIAKHFALICKMNPNTYFAGHWLVSLPGSLLWERKSNSAPPNVDLVSTYVAPSWSWACAEGRAALITRALFPADPKATASVLDVETTLVSHNLTGQVSWGAITLCGTRFPFITPLQDQSIETCKAAKTIFESYVEFLGKELRMYYKLDSPSTSIEDAWCVTVLSESPAETEFREAPTEKGLYGLLLVEVGGEKKRFRRVGVWFFVFRDTCPDYFTAPSEGSTCII
jgi:hypothetical protein